MDATGASADLWAALHAQGDAPVMPMGLPSHDHEYSASADGSDDEGDRDDDDQTRPRQRGHAPLLLPQGGLPSSFYATTGLPDVMPSFMMAHHLTKPYGDTATSSSELFLDDILRSHDDAFGATLAAGAGDSGSTGDLATTGRLTVERLSQLEDNYERKKKRAKINRRDLNSRFQELMDLLHLKEDRKLNRAKVLEKAVEHIEKLTAELKSVKAQLGTSHSHQQQQQQHLQYQSMPPFPGSRTPGLTMHGLPNTAAQMPLSMQQWQVATGPTAIAMNQSPMMWMPMPPTVSSSRAASRPSSATSGRGNGRRQPGAKKAAVSTATTQTSPDRTMRVEFSARPSLKRSRHDASDAVASISTTALSWIALEVHLLLEFCDAWSLGRLLATSRELRVAAKRDILWTRLCQHRWRLTSSSTEIGLTQWMLLHQRSQVPHSVGIQNSCLQFASGSRNSIGLWVSLVRRSNGRTTRTVLVDGRAVVRQVVELNLLVQNNHPWAKLRLKDQLNVGSSAANTPFRLITADSRTHLTPHLVTVNNVSIGASTLAAVELLHGDLCVLSVFIECEGVDLEQEFLQRVRDVTLQCELVDTRNQTVLVVDVSASVDEATDARTEIQYAGTARKECQDQATSNGSDSAD